MEVAASDSAGGASHPGFTPQLQLETLFVLDDDGCIVSTREPRGHPGPAFSLIRDERDVAWAVHVDLPADLKRELAALARTEPPATALTDSPRHADAYIASVGGRVDSGPVFTFPPALPDAGDVVTIANLATLEHHFRGWTSDELPERAPIVAITEDGHAVSVCFCARRSDRAAEAGVETAVPYRRRGFATRVTAAWARLIRQSGRLPLYSTSWSNAASLAVAHKIGLAACATDWNVYRQSH